jgi:CubicO group peptidase (beta-lactamase class C family)
MQLVDKGKINLNDPVIKYLPYFRLDDNRYSDITITQMLNHTSGMPNVSDYGYENPETDVGSAERWVRNMASEKLVSNPGKDFHYSDMAFDVLGDVIAKISGMSFEEYMHKNILLPLGMDDSSFFLSDIDEAYRASGHVGIPAQVSSVYPYNRRHAPSGTLNSSVREMSQWMLVNLNRGELNGKRILSLEKFDKLWSPSFEISQGVQLGLSWFLVDADGDRGVMHNGKDTGFQSHIMLFPDENAGVIIVSNWEDIDMRSIARGLHALILSDN